MKTKKKHRSKFLERRERLLENLGIERFGTSYEPWTKPLTNKQHRILEDLEDVISGLNNSYSRITTGEVIEKEKDLLQRFNSEIHDLDKYMLKAYRAGLEDHPLIKNWHDTMLNLGRNVLKKAKNEGAERGARSPLKRDWTLRKEIINLVKEGKTFEAIRTELIERDEFEGFPIPCSRNSFYELRQRLGVPQKSDLKK